MEELPRQTSPTAKWTKRIGLAAFLFFLIKGLLWLVVPAIIALFTIGNSN